MQATADINISSLTQAEIHKRDFDEIEADLWNGKSIAKEEAVEFLGRFREKEDKKFTVEELREQIRETENDTENWVDGNLVERYFDTLMDSLK